MSAKLKPPSSMQAAGKALWSEVVDKYDLRSDELVVLTSACKSADRIALVEKGWTDLGSPFLTKGSMGQEVIHPLFAEIQKLEAHQASLFARLKLPDEPGGERPNQQRDAAQQRWAAEHGKGA